MVGPDAVSHGVQVVLAGAGALGRLGLDLGALQAVEVQLIFLVQCHHRLTRCFQDGFSGFPTSGFGGKHRF